MARQLIQAGRAADDTPMPGMDSMCHNIHRWERGQGGLTERYKLHYCRAFGIRPDQFGADPAAHQSGWAYATAIDHRPLLAHLRLQLASVVFWQNRPRQARDLAEDGLRYLQDGPNAAHLHVKYARAAARLGDAGGARQAIADAQDARDREHSDRVLALGGEFGLSLATQSYFSGSALAELEGAESEAAGHLDRAVSLYDAGPGPDEQHWFGGKALAGVDLATIWQRAGALDAAIVALEPPLSLPSGQRINAVTTRLDLVRTELAAPIFQRSPQARELDERIEQFSQEAITADLHSLPGSPG